ncbi:MAG: DNA polymerase domain-containing protein [Candidatus Aenigmatarchaeota archaeon]
MYLKLIGCCNISFLEVFISPSPQLFPMETQYEGGFVKEPKAGMHKGLSVLDFRNLYPSIIITHNIDVKTFCKPCSEKDRVPGFEDRWFCKKPEGDIPKRLRKILEERWEVKRKLKRKYDEKLAKREQQLKLAANIAYGYFGYRGSPYYNVKIAESIAAFGRYYIKKVISDAEKAGLEVIYADTDAVFLKCGASSAKRLLKKVNRELPGVIRLEFRGYYERGLFVTTKEGRGAKKKYALMDRKGELLVRGFETRREDWCRLAKEVQKRILQLILLEKKSEAVSYARNMLACVREGKVKMEDLVINVQLAKPMSQYKAKTAHLAAARKMRAAGLAVSRGMIIRFVIVKGGGPLSERAEPYPGPKLGQIDFDYYAKKQVLPAALRVLQVFGVTEGQLMK